MTRCLIALCLTLAASLPAAADDFAVIESRLEHAEVARGSFEQRKFIAGFEHALVSSGRYLYSAQHGVLWTLLEPYAVHFRFTADGNDERAPDGDWLPMAGGDTGADLVRELTAALLAGDLAQLQTHFEMQAEIGDDGWLLNLVPRDPAWQRVFASARLSGDGRVRSLTLHEAGGDRTELSLRHADSEPLSDAERTALLRD